MSVSHNRVIDQQAVPGQITYSLPPDRWGLADGSAISAIALFVDATTGDEKFRDNIVVFVTRFIFDHGVSPADLIDHAYVDARALERWQEDSVHRWPARDRHSGWALQSGRYRSGAGDLFVASTYAVHERGNVGYLVQTTGTMRDVPAARAELVAAVQTVNFVD